MKADMVLRITALGLVLVPAWVFHNTSNFIHLVAEGRSVLFTSFWMTQILMGVGAWVYCVPVLATGLLWFRTLPGSTRSATPLVLLAYFLLASVLWAISTLGAIEPIASPKAVL
jgi:hypothetical protein